MGRMAAHILQMSFLLVVLLLLPPVGQAAGVLPLSLAGNPTRMAGEGHLAYWRDPTGKQVLKDALSAVATGQFTSIPGNLGLPHTPDAIWLAIRIASETNVADQWILQIEPTTLDRVELYQINGDRVLQQASGDTLPMSLRAMRTRSIAFPLTLSAGDTLLLLRIRTTSQMTAIPVLWQTNAFEQSTNAESIGLGLFFGFMLPLLAYNLIVALSGHDDRGAYFLYFGYILSATLLSLIFDGLLALYVLPEQPRLVNQLQWALMATGSVLGNYLFARILEVRAEHRISRALLMLIYVVGIISLISIPLGAFPSFLPWLLMSSMLALPVLAPHALRQMRSKDRGQLIFGASYLVLGVLVVVTLAMNLTLLPASHWTVYSAQYGQLFLAVSLHVGLYFRMKAREHVHDETAARLLRVSREARQARAVRGEQEQLLYMLGHEVRTPIAVISAAIDSLALIESENPRDPLKELRYQRIRQSVKRLDMLMQLVGTEQEILQRVSDTPRFEQLDLQRHCEKTLNLFADNKDRIQFEAAAHVDPVVTGDPVMLEFVLLNLFDNALKYATGKAPIKARLQSAPRNGQDGIRFTLCNQGRQLAPGMEERIFEKFIRIDEQHRQPGLGLGLYLARHIVEKHRGTLVARNSGTRFICFELWLPRMTPT